MEYDPEIHAGSWLFKVKACVDRTNEDYGSIDCDQGDFNEVELRFALCEELSPEEAAEHQVCKEPDEEEVPEPEPEEPEDKTDEEIEEEEEDEEEEDLN